MQLPCWAGPARLFCTVDSGSLSIRGAWTRRRRAEGSRPSPALPASRERPTRVGPGRCTQMADRRPRGGNRRGPGKAPRKQWVGHCPQEGIRVGVTAQAKAQGGDRGSPLIFKGGVWGSEVDGLEDAHTLKHTGGTSEGRAWRPRSESAAVGGRGRPPDTGGPCAGSAHAGSAGPRWRDVSGDSDVVIQALAHPRTWVSVFGWARGRPRTRACEYVCVRVGTCEAYLRLWTCLWLACARACLQVHTSGACAWCAYTSRTCAG